MLDEGAWQKLEEVVLDEGDVDGARFGPLPRAKTKALIHVLSRMPLRRFVDDALKRRMMLRRLLLSCRANDVDIPHWLEFAPEVEDLLSPTETRDVEAHLEVLGLRAKRQGE